jgi:hypothetical protein
MRPPLYGVVLPISVRWTGAYPPRSEYAVFGSYLHGAFIGQDGLDERAAIAASV